MTYNLDLARAACQISLNLGIVPTATLTAPASIGATSVSVSDVRPFLRQTILSWWDGTTEAPLAVYAATPSGHVNDPTPVAGTVQFDFSGQPYAGLQVAHSIGAVIATNLLDGAPPVQTAEMLGNGWPVWSAFVLDRADSLVDNNDWMGKVMLSIVYQLPAQQPDSNPMHPQLWARNRVQRADTDIDLFVKTVQKNLSFSVNGTPHANWTEKFMRSLRARDTLSTSGPVPVWEQYLDILVAGDEHQID